VQEGGRASLVSNGCLKKEHRHPTSKENTDNYLATAKPWTEVGATEGWRSWRAAHYEVCKGESTCANKKERVRDASEWQLAYNLSFKSSTSVITLFSLANNHLFATIGFQLYFKIVYPTVFVI